ncbi:MAG: hypothetical protein ABI832_13335 [bacterium]
MSRHLADHIRGRSAELTVQFLRIDHDQSSAMWKQVWQARKASPSDGRRVAEFARIERQELTD